MERGKRTLDEGARGCRQFRNAKARKRQAHEQRRAPVRLRRAPPARVQATLPTRTKLGLAVVVGGGAELADAVGHEAAPRHLVDEVSTGVDDIDHAGSGDDGGFFLVEQRAKGFEGRRRSRALNRRLKMLVAEATFEMRLPVPGTGHEQVRAGEGLQLRGNVFDRPIDHSPQGVHRDEAVERPCRGDACTGAVDDLVHGGPKVSARERIGNDCIRLDHQWASRASGRRTARGGSDGRCSVGGQMRNVSTVKRSSR